jgi:alpha-L-fucosidase 2
VQSHFVTDNGVREIWLLPALPGVWADGEVKGLVARGGFVTDITWRNGKVRSIGITSNVGGDVVVNYGVRGYGGARAMVAGAGEEVQSDRGRLTISTVKGGRYEFDIEWDD